MNDEQTQPEGFPWKTIIQAVVALLVLAAAGYGLYQFSIYVNDEGGDALTLSLLVLVGLALVIALMAGLGIVYSILGVTDDKQPLALPEGSVRALISFSLLLIFVCLATFIYSTTGNPELTAVGKVTKVTAQEIEQLRKTFSVVAEPARKSDGTLDTEAGTTPPTPLFNATYYSSQRRKEADDIGKQIFTTLATIFVSVVSFYFGSSTTASAVNAGAKTATEAKTAADAKAAAAAGQQGQGLANV